MIEAMKLSTHETHDLIFVISHPSDRCTRTLVRQASLRRGAGTGAAQAAARDRPCRAPPGPPKRMKPTHSKIDGLLTGS